MSNVDVKANRKKAQIETLQRIRRANNGIRGCAEILLEHGVNKYCSLTSAGANILFTVQQVCGLHFVIEASAELVDRLFYELEDKLEIGWLDDHLPEVREEAEAMRAYTNDDMTFEEFKKDRGIGPKHSIKQGTAIIKGRSRAAFSLGQGNPVHK